MNRIIISSLVFIRVCKDEIAVRLQAIRKPAHFLILLFCLVWRTSTLHAQSGQKLSIDSVSLDFGSTMTSRVFTIKNVGSGTLIWELNANQSWITLEPDSGRSTVELDSVTVIVSRKGLMSGEYSGRILVSSNGGADSIKISMTKRANNELPVIDTFPPPPPVDEGDVIPPIQVDISDDLGIVSVLLRHRKGGDPSFKSDRMTKQGEKHYSGVIPSDQATSRGVEFFVVAEDTDGDTNRTATVPIQVIVKGNGLMNETPQPGGSEQIAYRLISVPLKVDSESPMDVLDDDLGPYVGPDGKHEWRFFELLADQKYVEYPNISAMIPGKAFWLIVRERGRHISTGKGISNSTTKEYAIALHPRWNFIANPFNFRIPVETNVRIKNAATLNIRTFLGNRWNDLLNNKVEELLPFEGYAVYNPNLSTTDTLLIDPDLTFVFSPVNFLAETLSQAQPEVTLQDRHALNGAAHAERFFSIRILASCQEARDIDNFAAVYSDALRGRDNRDAPEPPVIGEYVSVYFPYPQPGPKTEAFCIDSRPVPKDGEVWEFEVKTNIRDQVQLTFEELESVPPEFAILLVDETLEISQNLQETNKYSMAGLGNNRPKRLKLIIGRGDFVNESIAGLNTIPSSIELSQNFPNPFNPYTTIRYGIPHEERVTLKVYNLLGKEIVTLVDNERKKAGHHVAIWDGRNQKGQFVASGIYFYHLQTGSLSMIKKMIYVQ